MSSSHSLHEEQDDAYLFSCRLSGLSEEVTVDQLYSLLSPVSPSIIIRILPTHASHTTHPASSSNLSTHPPSTSYLLNPHHSYTRSAEVLLRTEDEVDKLIEMDSKLRGYAIILEIPLHYLQRSSPFPSSQQPLQSSQHFQLYDSQRAQVLASHHSSQGVSDRSRAGGSLWDGKEGVVGASDFGGSGGGSMESGRTSSLEDRGRSWEDDVFLGGMENDSLERRSTRLDAPSLFAVPKANVIRPSSIPPRHSPWSSSRSMTLNHPVSSMRSTASLTPCNEGRRGSMMYSLGPRERSTIQGPRNLYVLNLPLATTQMEFEQMFAQYGKVEHACLLSMLDPQGRRRGFVLMSTHEEARTALSSAHGQSYRGCRLDISWSQVQKSTADEVQRGRMTNRQRFLPPPISPTIADYRLPVAFSSARPHAKFDPSSSYGLALRPWDDSAVGVSNESGKGILGRVVVMVALDPAHFNSISSLIQEASAFGEVSYACYMSPPPPYSTPCQGGTRSSTRSAMVRYVTAASADSAVQFMANPEFCEKKVKVRHIEWSDLDRITSVDRNKIMELGDIGDGVQRGGMWGQITNSNMGGLPSTIFNQPQHFSPYSEESKRLLAIPTSLSFSPTEPDSNSDPTPSSPLLRYSVKMPPPGIGNLFGKDKIWKAPGSSFGADGWSDRSSQDTPTKISNVSHQKLSTHLHAPAAVWWTGPLQLDGEAHVGTDGIGQPGRLRAGE